MLIGPFVKTLSTALASGVDFLVSANLLPLTSIFVEPAKVLFLNNAINHGIFTPLGIQQAEETGRSIFFLIEANPGPGLGILLAYMMFGKGSAKQTAGGAAIIHFLGGIHEIYFPYILMNPRLILAAMAGGVTGVTILNLFGAGLVSPASPGSIFAVLLMTPKDAYIGVLTSVICAAAVSFLVASFLMKTQKQTEGDDDDALANATSQMQSMKAESKGASASNAAERTSFNNVAKIIVACDAGMGSSAMGASMLRKKVQAAGLNISVTNLAINNLPGDVDIVVTHKDLTDRAKKHAPNAYHISLTNFLDGATYDNLVQQLLQSNEAGESIAEEAPAAAGAPFKIEPKNIHLGLTASSKEQAIKFAGEQLVKLGYVEPEYVDAMFDREKLVSTYLGESIAVPHGTVEAKDKVKQTGIVICQYPEGVQFGDDEDTIAKIVIGIAAKNDEHISVISAITNALDDDEAIAKLRTTKNAADVLAILNA
jgi:PTS system mannitol-specific IIC component